MRPRPITEASGRREDDGDERLVELVDAGRVTSGFEAREGDNIAVGEGFD
jgi:hypothetical protein